MSHVWEFFRAGGLSQVSLTSAEDLRNLKTLDQKLWVALASPVLGNTLDAQTLTYIDTDNDGRIRAPELLAAIDWMDMVVKDLGIICAQRDGLKLSQLNEQSEVGQIVLKSAKRILGERGKPDASEIFVEDTLGASALLNAMPFNGDGVLPPASIEDETLQALATQILETQGGVPDRSGVEGIDLDKVAAFFEALEQYQQWCLEAELNEDEVVPLGEKTAAAVEAYVAVRDKIEDYFMRCELSAFDPRARAHLIGDEKDWDALSGQLLTRKDNAIASFPLAEIAPSRALPLKDGINPAWAKPMQAFYALVIEPLLGAQDELTREQWADLGERFSAYETWLGNKRGASVEVLGVERVRELLSADWRAQIEAQIARDEAVRPDADALDAIDRAVRYQRDLHRLIENFVNFREFYSREKKAIFQIGTLYLDARSCELCMRVEDVAKHSAMAPRSFAYIAYCDCVRKSTNEKMAIAVAFTDGDSEFLIVGRNGLFYDHLGQDWDATVVKVVEQPISIRQAFWAPYKRLARFVSDQLEKFASSQDKAAEGNLSGKFTEGSAKLQTAATAPPAPTPSTAPGTPAAASAPTAATAAQTPPSAGASAAATGFDIAKYAGIFAAVGLALGFIISALTMLVSGFLSLKLWQMPLAIAGILLLISGPSMLLAAFKLRKRNLAPLLDANGWAINAQARINISFGTTLTKVAELPEGAKESLNDPYKDKRSPVWFYAMLLVIACAAAILWDMGLAQKWMGLTPEAPVVQEQPGAAAAAATATPASPATTTAAPAVAPAVAPAATP